MSPLVFGMLVEAIRFTFFRPDRGAWERKDHKVHMDIVLRNPKA